MYGYNAEQPIAIPIYTVLPYCVIICCKSCFTDSPDNVGHNHDDVNKFCIETGLPPG